MYVRGRSSGSGDRGTPTGLRGPQLGPQQEFLYGPQQYDHYETGYQSNIDTYGNGRDEQDEGQERRGRLMKKSQASEVMPLTIVITRHSG